MSRDTEDQERQIVAMGGGGFSMEPGNPRLDDFVLSLTKKPRPRVCFLPTASGDSPAYIADFHAAFPPERAEARHLTTFASQPAADHRAFLLDQDVIYVGGGNTANMLAVWRVHRWDEFLAEAWARGVVLAGLSAGMICWFEASTTDSFGGPADPLRDGLALLPGSACPHFDSEVGRRPAFHELIATGRLPAGYAADDGAALHFVGTELREVVSSRPQAAAYRVEVVGGQAVETRLPARTLGPDDEG